MATEHSISVVEQEEEISFNDNVNNMDKQQLIPDETFIDIEDIRMGNQYVTFVHEPIEEPEGIHSNLTIPDLGKSLLLAAKTGNTDEIRELLANGAPLTADWLGTTPLHIAAQHNNLEACEVLITAGLGKDTRTKVERTPMHMAASDGFLEIVDCLLKNGADPDARDMLYMTPLHWAVQNGHAEVAALLIRNGATTMVRSKFDLTPLDIAKQIDRSDIVQIINYTIRDPPSASANFIDMNAKNSSSIRSIVKLEQIEEPESEEMTDIPILIDENTQIASQMHLMEENTGHIYQQLVDDDEDTAPIQNQQFAIRIKNAKGNLHQINQQSIIAEGANHQNLTESMQYLQQHGITIIPDDESNILTTVMEAGHSVVLTEAGKQVLDSFKADKFQPTPTIVHAKLHQPKPKLQPTVKRKNVITVSADHFLAMTGNKNNTLQIVNNKVLKKNPQVKRFVMKKNKVQHIQQSRPDNENWQSLSREGLLAQLHKAHQLIQGYKLRLTKCELELHRCKRKCKESMEQQFIIDI